MKTDEDIFSKPYEEWSRSAPQEDTEKIYGKNEVGFVNKKRVRYILGGFIVLVALWCVLFIWILVNEKIPQLWNPGSFLSTQFIWLMFLGPILFAVMFYIAKRWSIPPILWYINAAIMFVLGLQMLLSPILLFSNQELDNSPSHFVEATVLRKEIRMYKGRRNYNSYRVHLIVSDGRSSENDIWVPESLYVHLSNNDQVLVEIGEGFFGLSYIRSIKKRERCELQAFKKNCWQRQPW